MVTLRNPRQDRSRVETRGDAMLHLARDRHYSRLAVVLTDIGALIPANRGLVSPHFIDRGVPLWHETKRWARQSEGFGIRWRPGRYADALKEPVFCACTRREATVG